MLKYTTKLWLTVEICNNYYTKLLLLLLFIIQYKRKYAQNKKYILYRHKRICEHHTGQIHKTILWAYKTKISKSSNYYYVHNR